MIDGYSPIVQAALGTLFTWGLTALGSALVFVFSSGKRNVLDASLGFAAGVMIAASFWSLLAPAIEMAEESGVYGADGQWAFVPVLIGFLLGSLFVYGADQLLPHMGDPAVSLARETESPPLTSVDADDVLTEEFISNDGNEAVVGGTESTARRRRHRSRSASNASDSEAGEADDLSMEENKKRTSWRRILLLIVAITVHNIPGAGLDCDFKTSKGTILEGLAVGVGFGAIGKTTSATFQNARNLALGIGIQNFPEGLAVSLPLKAAGYSTLRSFWYGQLSGMVEPVAGIIGALAVTIAEPLLPYALAFAAGAMIFVVVDDVIPEAQTCGNRRLCSAGSVFGFLVMMGLDVGLG